MRTALRWTGYVVAALLLIILIAVAAVWAISARKLSQTVEAKHERLIPMQQANLEEGQHLVLTRACAECHGGPGLGGAKFLDVPNVATLYAPNLPLLAKTVDDQQLAQAIRQGISHDGRALLIMPSESYSSLTDAETAALVKAIRALPATGTQTPPPRFGAMGRFALAAGKLKTGPTLVEEYAGAQAANLGPQYAAGRHIAVTVCSGCHGPTLAGKEAEPGVIAPDLNVTGAYDLPAFARLMRTGLPPSNRELKMMTGVSQKAFKHFTDEEIAGLHAYLVERAKRAP